MQERLSESSMGVGWEGTQPLVRKGSETYPTIMNCLDRQFTKSQGKNTMMSIHSRPRNLLISRKYLFSSSILNTIVVSDGSVLHCPAFRMGGFFPHRIAGYPVTEFFGWEVITKAVAGGSNR